MPRNPKIAQKTAALVEGDRLSGAVYLSRRGRVLLIYSGR